jgi:hypothetical protein
MEIYPKSIIIKKMTSLLDALPVAPPGVACPGCGWMESLSATVCRSCGDAMPQSVPPAPLVAAPMSALDAAMPGSPPAPPASPAEVLPELASPYAAFRSDRVRGYPPFVATTSVSAPNRGSFISPKNLALIVVIIAFSLWQWNEGRTIVQKPGILAPDEPIQTEPPPGKTSWKLGNHQIIPLAFYKIKARVLHKERYRWDPVSDLAPLDLGVGWGIMSDEQNASRSQFSNSNRFLSWHYEGADFPGELASRCIANMHLLPANASIRSHLLDFREGEIVQLTGYLVQVRSPGRNPWSSSLTRLDTGDGACEIMWVESAVVVK